ncbi:MAG: agmatinase family protein [Chitinophagales bacterium]|nr:agmatinase family protein [Chitinophagales bacterium]MDW8427705.1 agmatinase family protein [Chitinophagales bacterium]
MAVSDTPFDPNDAAAANGIFGLPHQPEEARVIILPVPWEVTVSYRTGTAQAAQAILRASVQVDLYDADFPDAWKKGFFMLPPDKKIARKGQDLRKLAENHLNHLLSGKKTNAKHLKKINEGCRWLNDRVRQEVSHWLDQGKRVVLLGGDHSTPLGYLQALAQRHTQFGILHLDAHCDLRKDYEGFTYSHASIMHQALLMPQISRLVQVGIRDYCEAEWQRIQKSNGRIVAFLDRDLKRQQFAGTSWLSQCAQIVDALPEKVYLSFDVDVLAPHLCPNTGTPVPGGLEFEQTLTLLLHVVHSGRHIVGCDLTEVSVGNSKKTVSDAWDAIVGARLLYRLACLMAETAPTAG